MLYALVLYREGEFIPSSSPFFLIFVATVRPHSGIGIPARELPVRVQGRILLPGQDELSPLLQRGRHGGGVREEAHGMKDNVDDDDDPPAPSCY